MKTNQNESVELRPLLEEKTRYELIVVAKKLNVSGFTRLQKSALIDLLLSADRAALSAIVRPTWWRRHHNHIYGAASIVGVVLAVLFFVWPSPDALKEIDATESEIQREARDSYFETEVDGVGDDFVMNTDVGRRDKVLGINVDWDGHVGGIVRLDRIGVTTLETLFRERFVDPNDSQDEAPSASELLAFMQKHPEVLAHGYAVSPDREDYRVTIDGLSVQSSFATAELKLAFLEFCKDADELDLKNGLRAWWD